MSETPPVLVIGDPAVDQLIYARSRAAGKPEFDWQRYQQYSIWEIPGGVALSVSALADLGFAPTCVPVERPDAQGKQLTLKTLSMMARATVDATGHCDGLCDTELVDSRGSDDRPIHLRVREFAGYFSSRVDRSAQRFALPDHTFDFVFLNDAGGAARQLVQESALGPCIAKTTVIVHKMHLPLDLESPLTAGLRTLDCASKTLVVTAHDLRSDGTRLRASLSWRMFFDDLEAARSTPTLSKALKIYNHVVVLVAEDGAFALTAKGGLMAAYDTGGIEGDHNASVKGDSLSKTNVFACSLLKACTMDGGFAMTAQALASALATTRDHARRCLTVQGLQGDTNPTQSPVCLHSVPHGLKTVDIDPATPAAARGPADLLSLAGKIVREGTSGLTSMDHARFGKFLTVDPVEIEGFRAIKATINGYIDDRSRQMPLSLAVFGPPGSGKSFGITQLTKGRPEIDRRVFNMSEASAEALPGYFHEMRDITLKGKLPLLFFDEFDSHQCDLVARFLAPMQDGEIRDGARLHPIGRGILVFAGGTAPTARAFAAHPDRKHLKIPDFVSRLAGTIDIRGINKVDKQDSAYVLRRAILLRSLLEQNRPDIVLGQNGVLNVQDSLVAALLTTKKYLHGARSMEKIVVAGALMGTRPIFGGSDLPDKGVLSLHLKNPDAFLRAATRNDTP